MTATEDDRIIRLVSRVRAALDARGVGSAVIGAMALAAHGFPRATDDFDLATATDSFTVLREVARELAAEGLHVELREPDAEDPLFGVLAVSTEETAPVEVVNFRHPLAREAIQSAATLPSVPFPVVDRVHLVALKLYAGGPQDVADVIQLLERSSPLPLEALRDICVRHGLSERLERCLAAI